jgi:hypothetical protein
MALARVSGGTALAGLVDRTVEELRHRDWTGDEELARQLGAGASEPGGIEARGVPVDLDDLGEVLDGPAGAGPGLLDLDTGTVWSCEVLENARDAGIEDVPEGADGTRWIEVWPEGHAARDLKTFTATVSDPRLRERLELAVHRKGAFRNFRSLLEPHPDETSRWHAYNDDRRVGRARAWLAEAGFRPEPSPTTPA